MIPLSIIHGAIILIALYVALKMPVGDGIVATSICLAVLIIGNVYIENPNHQFMLINDWVPLFTPLTIIFGFVPPISNMIARRRRIAKGTPLPDDILEDE